MPAKSIQLPASCRTAIEAVESLAASASISFGLAAAQLIEGALASSSPGEAMPDDAAPLTPFQRTWFARGGTLDALFDDLIARAERPDCSAELAAAIARAEAAEARLAAIRSAIG